MRAVRAGVQGEPGTAGALDPPDGDRSYAAVGRCSGHCAAGCSTSKGTRLRLHRAAARNVRPGPDRCRVALSACRSSGGRAGPSVGPSDSGPGEPSASADQRRMRLGQHLDSAVRLAESRCPSTTGSASLRSTPGPALRYRRSAGTGSLASSYADRSNSPSLAPARKSDHSTAVNSIRLRQPQAPEAPGMQPHPGVELGHAQGKTTTGVERSFALRNSASVQGRT